MQAQTNKTQKTTNRDLIITRVFDAPREMVWAAWTDPAQVKYWWGPKNFTAPSIKIDLRVGGEYLYDMRSPDGKDFWSKGTFKKIITPELLVLTDSFADEKGNTVSASYYGLSTDFPLESLVKITFEKYEANETKLTLRYSGIPDKDFDNAQMGWNESFDKLDALLKSSNPTMVKAEPGKQELFITHIFNAPREKVFKAFIDPTLYVQWLGPAKYKMTLLTFEPRNGGRWRYIHEGTDGSKFGFHGVFHEILEPSRLIDTFEFEGLPEKGHVSLETAIFEELPGDKTKFTAQSVFQSVADRDGMIGAGMEEGVRESYRRLDELLEKMKRGK